MKSEPNRGPSNDISVWCIRDSQSQIQSEIAFVRIVWKKRPLISEVGGVVKPPHPVSAKCVDDNDDVGMCHTWFGIHVSLCCVRGCAPHL